MAWAGQCGRDYEALAVAHGSDVRIAALRGSLASLQCTELQVLRHDRPGGWAAWACHSVRRRSPSRQPTATPSAQRGLSRHATLCRARGDRALPSVRAVWDVQWDSMGLDLACSVEGGSTAVWELRLDGKWAPMLDGEGVSPEWISKQEERVRSEVVVEDMAGE